jgi:lysyl-tRNA synthetase class 2
MSRTSLSFLRPYLYRTARPLKSEHTRAYLSVQKRFAQTVADEHTGSHDVEKQKRLEQLKNVKALGDYHPRLAHHKDAPILSLRDFTAKYESIEDTKADVVSVFGMPHNMTFGALLSDSVRKGALSTVTRIQADVPRH